LGEAHEAFSPDDHVVVDPQIEKLRALDELAGEAEILPARCGIAARVVMQQDDLTSGRSGCV
jgi:hypothetical protein